MATITLSENDSGKTIEVTQGDTIEIRLPENPTTGYQWAVEEVDENILTLQSSEYVLPQDPRIGEGGTRVVQFQAKQARSGEVALKYWREWEGDSSIIKRFRIDVRVQP
jgi:inhibitor of cysteine peptidase